MNRLGMRTVILFLLLSLCSTFWAFPALAKEETKTTVSPPESIVFLFSFGQGLPYYEKLYKGFLSVTRPAGITHENLFIEYMDLVRNSEKEYRLRLADLYRYKYSKRKIRMIIVEGEPALKFLLEEGRNLFPQAPAFCIYGPETIEWDKGGRRIILLPFDQDVRGTLDYALALLPQTQRVLYVSGSTEVEKRRELKAQREVFAARRGQLEFEYTSDLSYDELIRRIPNLPSNSIILFTYFFADKTGQAFIPRDVAKRIIEIAKVPVFGIYETVFDVGIVGGSIARFEVDGAQAAKVTLDILNGKLVPSEQVQTFSTIKTPMFDWQVLRRWGLDESKLPKGSTLVHHVPSFWDLYKWYVLGAIAFCLFLTIMIAALLVQKWRRQLAEKQYSFIVEQASDAILVLDAGENRFVEANPMAQRLFACSREELLQSAPQRFCPPLRPDSQPTVGNMKPSIDRALAGEVICFEETVHNSKGETLYCEVRMARLPIKKRPLIRISYLDITERKQAEEEVQLEKDRFLSILNTIPDGVYIVDHQYNIQYVNPVIEKDFGPINERKCYSYFHDLTEVCPWCKNPEVFAGKSVQWEWYSSKNDKYYDLFDMPFTNADGSISKFEIFHDITERKQAEEALKESEKKFKEIFESMTDVFYRTDIRGSLLIISPSVEQLFGYAPDEVIGKKLSEFYVTPDQRDQFLSVLREKGDVKGYEAPIRAKDGSVVWVSTNAQFYRDKEGKIIGVHGITRDITKRKQAEAVQKEKQAQLQAILDYSPALISIKDLNGNVILANRNFAVLDTPPLHEFVGKNVFDLFQKEVAENLWKNDQLALKAGGPVESEEIVKHKDGIWHTYLTVKFPIYQEPGQPFGTCAISTDITERKRAEEQIQASLREKDILISEIHHRVKNNLQVISGLLDLQSRASKNPEVFESFRESQDRIRAMAMVHEKLYNVGDFSRIDLAGYVRSLSQELFQTYNINPGEIDLTIQADGEVYADIIKAIPCGLIMNELISNALKHAFPGGRPGNLQIIIGETKSKGIEIVVRDNGLGLLDDVDLHQPRSVGLYLVNGLVKNQLDGQMEVRRDNGTEFRIIFPL